MKRLLVLTEVYRPENFIINELVDNLSDSYSISVVTRVPSYPYGLTFPGFKNIFSKTKEEKGICVYRFPVFLNYKRNILAKIGNLLWQPFAYGILILFIPWDRLFIYQTGSLYSYSFLWPLRWSRRISVIWSQDLWPEAGYEFGFPKIYPLKKLFNWLTSFTLGHFNKILVQSEAFEEHYRKKYGKVSKVVYNFSNSNKSQIYPQRKNNTSIIYAGNIGSVQNLDGIITLFNILKKSALPIETLDIYGDGSRYEELRGENTEREDIIFHGRIPSKIIRKKLEQCRYAIFSLVDGPVQKTIPSRLQFFYNTNVPIIYLGAGATKDFILKNHCGIVVENSNMNETTIINKILDFESQIFQTPDVFNKNIIIQCIKDHLK